MAFWKKDERPQSILESDVLITRRNEWEKKFPDIMAAWEKEDSGPVKTAAETLAVVQLMQNPSRILESKATLQRAIWKRDAIKENFQRHLDDLNAQIEALSHPTCFAKVQEWANAILELKDKKIVEKIDAVFNMKNETRMIKFKSNHAAIEAARQKLLSSIKDLRDMGREPLSKIHLFIDKVESDLKKISFAELEESKTPVTERAFDELVGRPGTVYYETGRVIGGRIEKDFNLPVKQQ